MTREINDVEKACLHFAKNYAGAALSYMRQVEESGEMTASIHKLICDLMMHAVSYIEEIKQTDKEPG